MKKICLFFALAACALTLSAQHVTPLNIQLVDFALDSMRTKYAVDPQMYKSELQRIQLTQDANAKALEAAAKQLKDEKTFAKDQAAYLKKKEAAYTNLQKLYANEQAILADMEELIDKNSRKVQKTGTLNTQTVEGNANALLSEKKDLAQAQEELAIRQQAISLMLEKIPAEQAALADFELEIQNKEVDLKQLQQTHDTREATIKAELKNLKATLKGK